MEDNVISDESYLFFKESRTNTFSNLLKYVDILGRKPKLQVGPSSRHKSAIGGLLSILAIIVVLVLFYVFSEDLIYKINPNISETSAYDVVPRTFNITRKNFNFLVGLQDKNYDWFLDPEIFQISVQHVSRRTVEEQSETIVTNIKTRPCILEEKLINNEYGGVLKEKESLLSNTICLDSTHPSTKLISIAGSFENERWDYLTVSLSVCQNGTIKGITCKSQEQIDSKLGESFIAINYLDRVFNLNNYTTPDIVNKRNLYSTSSNSFYKEWNIYMKNIDVITDDAVLMDNGVQNRKSYLKSDYNKEVINLSQKVTTAFIKILIRLSSERILYTRRYKKIQDVVAQINGFISLSYYIAMYILYAFDGVNLTKTLINFSMSYGLQLHSKQEMTLLQKSKLELDRSIANLKPKKKSIEIIKFNPKSMNHLQTLTSVKAQTTIDFNTKISRNEKTSTLRNSKTTITETRYLENVNSMVFQKKKIRFSCLQVAILAFGCNKKDKFERYLNGVKLLNQSFDTRRFMRKQIEVDLLKKVLLTEDQEKVFDIAVKSYCPSNLITKQIEEEDENYFKLDRDFISAYTRMISSEDKYSYAIINLLGEQIKEELQQN